jgi:IS66 Orf2 like protein
MTSGLAMRMRIELHQLMQRHGIEPAPVVLPLADPSLEQGAFRWPPISDGVMRLSASQLAVLVDGMDWSRLYAHDVPRPTATS